MPGHVRLRAHHRDVTAVLFEHRLVNELRRAGITTAASANQYLREHFLASYNATFGRPPADPASAFVALGRVDLEQILCHEEERVVARDNTVRLDALIMQLATQRSRRTCAGLHVLVRRHLDGRHSVWYGSRCLGRFTGAGQPLSPLTPGVAHPLPTWRSPLLSPLRPRASRRTRLVPAPRALSSVPTSAPGLH